MKNLGQPTGLIFILDSKIVGTASTPANVPLRHWAFDDDKMVFMWKEHNGRNFGHQKLMDGDMELDTNWFSYGKSSWMVQLRIERPKWGQRIAFLPYFAIQDQASQMAIGSMSTPSSKTEFLRGQSEAVGGQFLLKIRNLSEKHLKLSYLATREGPFANLATVNQMIKDQLVPNSDNEFVLSNKTMPNLNFAAIQIEIEENTTLEFVFQADGDETPGFQAEFVKKRAEFKANFARAFPIPNGTEPALIKMAECALSNLLGGIGVWHGSLWMHSAAFKPSGAAKQYGPLSLISAVPSRTGFPRGFLWDEGHHNLLISRFDPKLSLDIVAAYLDTMNINGWIPREVALGPEAEARIPAQYLVQDDDVANPPMFFKLLQTFVSDSTMLDRYGVELARLYPRMKTWYIWLRNIQRGPKPGTFRWRGRNGTTDRQLNPDTLASGLDDYPRASHPTDEEYHVDLRCWMAISSSVLLRLANLANDTAFIPALRTEVEQLNNAQTLDNLHWSEDRQRYYDYGLHSLSVKMINELSPEGKVISVRKVLEEPKYRLVTDVVGYMNLFPMLFKLLPANSPRLGHMLRDIADPEILWTPFGLRSVSTQSTYYNAWNAESTPPLWRRTIWINLNYYALGALFHYANLDGPNQRQCAQLYKELRQNIYLIRFND
uniref:Mannosyl-oligosaccharide glucosidase n=1 Tax=Globodera pallida TaxID=36090 RepID=A0A183C9X9_GLOPA